MNVIKPASLVRNSLAPPPQGFSADLSADGAPLFFMRFDFLTTADAAARKNLMALPLHDWWRHWLRARIRFVGTTVASTFFCQ